MECPTFRRILRAARRLGPWDTKEKESDSAVILFASSWTKSNAGSILFREYSETTRKVQIMFSKAGIIELHATMHERLDLLLHHVATMPDELTRETISGFGHPSIWKQLVHILTCEEGWVHDLQNKAFPGWREEDCPTMAALLAAKDRIREATRTYLDGLTEEQLNTTLTTRPVDWGGELRSPAFILLHVITHAFHHKGQVVAMLRILGYPAPDTDLQPV
jgi:uncharacterized damage-inducible protein DinB